MRLTNIREESAIDFLAKSADLHKNEITIICLAPVTNIAATALKYPEFAGNIHDIVVLGGTYLGQGNTSNMCSEFNFYKDPEAAKVVFDSFSDISLIPIEVPYTFKAMD